jgi:predicted GNAT family acetyltransferase
LASTAAAVGAIAFAYGAAGDRPADITEVELATALFSRGSELARTRASIADDRATLWLARLDDAPAATAWTIRHDGAAEIVGVGTVAAYRDRGLATAVTAHAAAAALADGADLVFLTAEDKRSAELYARLGFEVVANVCIAERMDADG